LAGEVATAEPNGQTPFHAIDISAHVNADIFTTFDVRTDGAVDSGRSSFPAEMMPPSGATFEAAGIPLRFPSKEDGALNAVRCEGQTLSVEQQESEYLYLLATAADGNQRAELHFTYADGSHDPVPFDVNDWCAENPGLGAVHGVVSDYRHTLGGKQTCKTSIWLIPVKLPGNTQLTAVTLPENPSIYVVAMTLGPAGEERLIQTYVKDAFFPSQEEGIDRLVLCRVIEPEATNTLHILGEDNWDGNLYPFQSIALEEGVQSIPIWLPIKRRRTYYFEIGTNQLTSLDQTNLFLNAPRALIKATATQPVHPADADLGMAPAWQLVATPDTAIHIDVHIADGPSDSLTLRAALTELNDGGFCATVSTDLTLTETAPATRTVLFEPEALAPGAYALDVTLLVHGLPYAQKHFELTVIDDAKTRRPFGARETDLGYHGPVWTNWDEAISYDEAWEGFNRKDIVIDFPDTPYRYVFWKGASYAPIWLFDRSFITLEWLEAWPRQEGAVDCVEPLQDKTCKYSRVELLSSTPARARVKWNYAETDFNLKVIHGETAEEIYTLYPDGIGTRKVTGHFEKGRWHECVEFIVGSVAGTTPAENYPPQALTLLNTEGDRFELFWPTPQESDLPEWGDYIGVAHSRNEPDVFLATDGLDTGLHVFSNNPDWLSEMFFCMPHWPIQRGLPTTNERSIEDCMTRPTHASLLNIYAGPHELYQDRTVWALLLGIAPDDEQELRDLVHGWLEPPAVTCTSDPDADVRYDIYQRAYELSAEDDRVELHLATNADQPQVRPAFVISTTRALQAVSLNGEALAGGTDYEAGWEDDQLVVWLRRSFYEPAELVFQLGEPTKHNPEKEGGESLQ
jgi:hypothetical protein